MKGEDLKVFATRGYTLTEILTVLFIIGLLLSLSVISFYSQNQRSKVNVTKANLESIRTAIALYYEVEGVYPSNNLDTLYNGASPHGRKYLGGMPPEAVTNNKTVYNSPFYSGGWYYNFTTHVIVPDLNGNDMYGVPFSSY